MFPCNKGNMGRTKCNKDAKAILALTSISAAAGEAVKQVAESREEEQGREPNSNDGQRGSCVLDGIEQLVVVEEDELRSISIHSR
jgi:hypothetical protein